jgi:starch-binding outer membrane protein, SusD/RagB family
MRFFEKNRSHGSRTGAALVLGLFSLTACSGLFDVDNPGSLLDEDLETPFLEGTLSTSAEGELVGPFSSALVNGEMLGDHVWHPSVQDFALLIDAGYRDRDISVVESLFNNLASAIWVADDMVNRLQSLVDNPGSHIGIADSHFMGGLARMTIAAYYEQVVYDMGTPITPAQAIEDAIGKFQSAAQVASGAGNTNLAAASLGAAARGYRSLYYEGGGSNAAHMQQAESLARQALDLDGNFRKNLRYGQPGASNGHFAGLVEGPYHRMHESYAFRPDPVTGEPDPRIIHDAQPHTPGPRGEVRYYQRKFGDRTDPLPASRAAEAEIIVAEARLIDGDLAGAVEWINRVRARSGLPAFQSGDAQAIWDQLIYERDTEFWLEGRRWEDHRYYNIVPMAWVQYNVDRGVGPRWPISDQERFNNPNAGG